MASVLPSRATPSFPPDELHRENAGADDGRGEQAGAEELPRTGGGEGRQSCREYPGTICQLTRAENDAFISVADQTARSTISFLISAMALAGLRPFGQTCAQFMMVWQR